MLLDRDFEITKDYFLETLREEQTNAVILYMQSPLIGVIIDIKTFIYGRGIEMEKVMIMANTIYYNDNPVFTMFIKCFKKYRRHNLNMKLGDFILLKTLMPSLYTVYSLDAVYIAIALSFKLEERLRDQLKNAVVNNMLKPFKVVRFMLHIFRSCGYLLFWKQNEAAEINVAKRVEPLVLILISILEHGVFNYACLYKNSHFKFFRKLFLPCRKSLLSVTSQDFNLFCNTQIQEKLNMFLRLLSNYFNTKQTFFEISCKFVFFENFKYTKRQLFEIKLFLSGELNTVISELSPHYREDKSTFARYYSDQLFMCCKLQTKFLLEFIKLYGHCLVNKQSSIVEDSRHAFICFCFSCFIHKYYKKHFYNTGYKLFCDIYLLIQLLKNALVLLLFFENQKFLHELISNLKLLVYKIPLLLIYLKKKTRTLKTMFLSFKLNIFNVLFFLNEFFTRFINKLIENKVNINLIKTNEYWFLRGFITHKELTILSNSIAVLFSSVREDEHKYGAQFLVNVFKSKKI